jgi:hypothetical protein
MLRWSSASAFSTTVLLSPADLRHSIKLQKSSGTMPDDACGMPPQQRAVRYVCACDSRDGHRWRRDFSRDIVQATALMLPMYKGEQLRRVRADIGLLVDSVPVAARIQIQIKFGSTHALRRSAHRHWK